MLSTQHPLWQAILTLPDGSPATEERLARVVLTACGLRDAQLEEVDSEATAYGIWLVSIPEKRTRGWDLDASGTVYTIGSRSGSFKIEVTMP